MYRKKNYSFICKCKKNYFQCLTPDFEVSVQSQMQQQHLRLPSTMFMTLLSTLLHIAVVQTQVSPFSNLN